MPSTPELRNLRQWVDRQAADGLYASHSVARDHPEFGSLTATASGVLAVRLSAVRPDYLMWFRKATASGVLAVRLSAVRPDYLMWFRKEQLLTVTWAGDPHKPMEGNDPLELSPRRSFAAWSEIVRGTAAPWAPADLALARAIGAALVDIILQVYAVRLLVAEHQLAQVRRTVVGSSEPVVIADADGQLMLANAAFLALAQRPSLTAPAPLVSLEDLATLFVDSQKARRHLTDARQLHKAWRGELVLTRRTGEAMPVGVRLETVSGPGGRVLGFVVILLDFSARHRAAAARRQLEESLQRTTRGAAEADADQILTSIVTNASIAAMDIAEGANGTSLAPQLEELDASAQRATLLYQHVLHAARRG